MKKVSAEKRAREYGDDDTAFIGIGCLRGLDVTLTPSKCNNIYIRVQYCVREGRARGSRKGERDVLRSKPPLYRLSLGNGQTVPQISIVSRNTVHDIDDGFPSYRLIG